MEQVLFGFSYLLLFISIINYFTIRTPFDPDEVRDSVTVLLPMRNEESNIADCISSLKAQIGVPYLTCLLINDQSTDKTVEIARAAIADDSRFSILSTDGPRLGWLGKVSALQSGFEHTRSDFTVTLDADVRLKPNAIASTINLLHEAHLDFTSPYPRQIAESLSERLIQPLLRWTWMTTVILRLAEKIPHTSTAVANGQFFAVRTSALNKIDGFTSVQKKILDDVEIARTLIAAGFRGVVTEGSGLAETRMYKNFDEIKQGYGKSLHAAFGGFFGTLFAIAVIFISGVLPVIFIAMGSPLGWLLLASVVMSRLLSDTQGKSNSMYSLAHPISSALLIYLICYSWAKRGTIQWKGRTV
jgi:cellulose synthase/poly-beta-1,6-N-acetylglucosamine synthase-like glycosyltransferase